jgi:hypothetical protein
MSIPSKDDRDVGSVRVRRARVETLDLYEIKEEELYLFEKGSPADLQLNFGIFLFSLACSAVVALSTADFSKHPTIRTTYVVVAVVGVLLGGYLGISWLLNRTSTKGVCVEIRRRMKESASLVKDDDAPPTVAAPPPGGNEPRG